MPVVLWPMKLERGRLHRCCHCRGVWLERDAAVALFGGRVCTFEPAPDVALCGVCNEVLTVLRFADTGPLRVCGEHGVWLAHADRALLPEPVQRKLRRRETVDVVLAWCQELSDWDFGGSSEYSDVSSDSGSGGDASCGGCGGCGGD